MRLGAVAGLLMLGVALAGCAAVGNALRDPEVDLERVVVRDVRLEVAVALADAATPGLLTEFVVPAQDQVARDQPA